MSVGVTGAGKLLFRGRPESINLSMVVRLQGEIGESMILMGSSRYFVQPLP